MYIIRPLREIDNMKFSETLNLANNIESGQKDKFLSKVFGIISEPIVNIWCNSEASSYTNLGRPTINPVVTTEKPLTLDFTLKNKQTNKIYVAECKCLTEYGKFKYLTLRTSEQFKPHLTKQAFKWFLEISKTPHEFQVKVDKKTIPIDGGILIWGAVDENYKEGIIKESGFADILSIE